MRGETFVTRKITRALARIAMGLQNKLYLGNLSAQRDWGHARDYVEAMYLMLQQDEPDDFVIATGITTEIREFVQMVCKELNVEIEFSGSGQNEKGIITQVNNPELILKPGQVVVEVDPDYFRPTEVDLLIGDATKAKEKLNWQPKYTLQGLILEMIEADLEHAKKELLLKKEGYNIPDQHE